MDVYSASLGLAMAAAGGSALAAVAAWRARRSRREPQAVSLHRLAMAAALGSLPTVAFSFLFHRLDGLRPGTSEAMAWSEFLLEHRALVTVALLAVAVLAWLQRADRSG